MSSKIRADELVVQQQLSPTRSQAQALIMAGKIRLPNGQLVDKPGRLIDSSILLTLEKPYPYVSRGGEKLAGFLDAFSIDVQGLNSLDIGASTGGFTDCLLQRGVIQAVCVDVGHGQLHHKLQIDTRVTSLEKLNARHLKESDLPVSKYDIIVMDLSFISLTKVLPNAWTFLKTNGRMIALIKPQFEADKKEVSKGKGVIKDIQLQETIRDSIKDFGLNNLQNSILIGIIPCTIKGADGNQEYLIGFEKTV